MKNKKISCPRSVKSALSGLLFLLIFVIPMFFPLIGNAAGVNQGANIPYNRYLPGATYSTHIYTVDGRIAYCIESEKQAVPSGNYEGGGTFGYDVAPMLVLSLYYGYGGGGAWQMKQFFAERFGITLSDEQQYLYTHIVANYAYVGANMSSTPGQYYKGLTSQIAEDSGINEWIRYLGRVLGGTADYTGKTVKGGYITYYETGNQKIAVMGNLEYNTPTPVVPPVIPEDETGKITVRKTGEVYVNFENGDFVWEEKPLAGAQFELFAKEDIVSEKRPDTVYYHAGDSVGKLTTKEDGIAELSGLYPGVYLLKETKAPEGFVKMPEDTEIVLAKSEENRTIEAQIDLENAPAKGCLLIKKEGESLTGFENGEFIFENRSLQGAEFDLFSSDDELICHFVTDEDGNARVDDLPFGTYRFVETKAPYGMIPDSTEHEFTVSYLDDETPLVLHEETIVNEREKLTLTVYKKKQGGDEPLSGGEFSLYAKEDILNYKNEVILNANDLIAVTEAVDGVVDFSMDLPNGMYYIKETKTIPGYLKNNENYEIDFHYGGDANAECTIYNKPVPPAAPKQPTPVEPTEGIVLGAGGINYVTEDTGSGKLTPLIDTSLQEASDDPNPGGMAAFYPKYDTTDVVSSEARFSHKWVAALALVFFTAVSGAVLLFRAEKKKTDRSERSGFFKGGKKIKGAVK